MKNKITRFCFISAVFSLGILFASCGQTLGYSVMLWSNPEHHMEEGTVVRVYIKSGIMHVYVVSLPGSKDKKDKIELPVWQMTEPVSRSKVKKVAARYEAYAHTYAKVLIDGLPIRQLPANTSKQMYRLRQDEIIRVLYEGKGQPVTNGKGVMEGKWLRVLTSTGTQGWCFSHSLSLYQVTPGSTTLDKPEQETVQTVDTVLEGILGKPWYPDSYLSMIQSSHIDLDRMSVGYGFDPGKDSGTVRIILPGVSLSYPYSGVTKTGDSVYDFNGTSVTMTVKGENTIVLRYTDADGKLTEDGFVSLTDDISALIDGEKQRRAAEYQQLCTYGPVYKSSNYGRLVLNEDGTFQWTGLSLLSPTVIPKGTRGSGTVQTKYFITNSLKSSYDGVLTFHFNGLDSEVNFFYKYVDNGLRLEDGTNAKITGGVVMAGGSTPLVVFFNRPSSGSGN